MSGNPYTGAHVEVTANQCAVFDLWVNMWASDDPENPPYLWEVYVEDCRGRDPIRQGRCASIEDGKRAAEAAVLGLLREMLATMEAT